MAAVKEEVDDVRGKLILKMCDRIDELLARVDALEFGQQNQATQLRLQREDHKRDKHRLEKPVREQTAADRARDRCVLEKTSDPSKFQAYYAEELHSVG